MKQRNHTCTEPDRWNYIPNVDAPAEEILAYLHHREECPFHAFLDMDEELEMNLLLHAACKDLDCAPFQRQKDMRFISKDRVRIRRLSIERGLAWSCVAACIVLLLWTWGGDFPFATREEVPLANTPPGEEIQPPGQVALSTRIGQLYISRYTTDLDVFIPPSVATDSILHVAAPLQRGSMLRITNPKNGRSTQVRVAARTLTEKEILISDAVGSALDMTGNAYLFVERVSFPSSVPNAIAP